ncbi:MAG: hypothetical protein P8J89_09950 [Phycisphaerales bacterium]|nr:hypothetical protein [Phycisphaerales bacterium]
MKNSTTHLLTALTALTLATGATALAKPAFEDVALGKAYLCMDSDTSSGVTYMFSDYEMTPGVFTNNGNAYIDNIGNACGYNKELALSNIYVTYDYAAGGAPEKDPSILFGWYGGNMNLSINGDRHWGPHPGAFPPVIGGCNVNIVPLGGGCGRIDVVGNVNTISFGGQEFWLDDIQDSEGECDWGYEDLSPSLMMGPGMAFTTDGLPSKTRDFILWDGTPFSTGNVQVSVTNQACNTGKELELRSATVLHDILGSGVSYENVEWAYGYYGGHINFEINGDFRFENNVNALDGQTIGGGLVTIVPVASNCGWIQVDGIVDTIAIGGQELFVDCLKGDEVEPSTAPGDLDGDGDVDVDDLMSLIASYGSSCSGCPEDIDGDGDVDVDDLMILLSNYGT